MLTACDEYTQTIYGQHAAKMKKFLKKTQETQETQET